MKRITALTMAALCLAIIFISCNRNKENEFTNEENERFSNADKQMESWFWTRAYPDPSNINEKFSGGLVYRQRITHTS